MRSWTLLSPLTLLLACGGSVPATSTAPAEPCSSTDAGDAGESPDVSVRVEAAVAVCSGGLTVETMDPTAVPYSGAHEALITLRGCGFTGVRDVEVNVYSVPFRVLDDRTLVFLAAREPLDASGEYPLQVQVDVIKNQPEQTQTFLTYTRQ